MPTFTSNEHALLGYRHAADAAWLASWVLVAILTGVAASHSTGELFLWGMTGLLLNQFHVRLRARREPDDIHLGVTIRFRRRPVHVAVMFYGVMAGVIYAAAALVRAYTWPHLPSPMPMPLLTVMLFGAWCSYLGRPLIYRLARRRRAVRRTLIA